MNKYKYFWGGVFSQWWTCSFELNKVKYNCTEQYMMAQKALIFGDYNAYESIMDATSPKVKKAIGRTVKNFDVQIWNENKVRIVYTGNKAKFTQNPDLLGALFATDGEVLVEASPYDKVWGIGLGESTARITPPDHWPGENLLGRTLTKLRINLLEDYERSLK